MDTKYLLVTESAGKSDCERKYTRALYGGFVASLLFACGFVWSRNSIDISETWTSLFSTASTADADVAIAEDPPSLHSAYTLNTSSDDYIKMFGVGGPKMDHIARNSTVFSAASLHGEVDVDSDLNAHAIYQGQLGDCYFDAALASIAHWHPDLIENMFTHIDVANGVFKTKWFVGGRREIVSVNDKVPTDPKSGIPFFLWTGSEMTLWPALLEKAFAKIFGSYKQIEGGLQIDVFHHMLGVPVDMYISAKKWQVGSCVGIANSDALWEKVDEAVRNKWPMGIGTSTGGFHGISGGHAYSLYGASPNYQGHGRCVRVRNPWGSNKYSGDIRGQSKNVGDFWITWQEFLQNFIYVAVARVQKDYSVPKYWNVKVANGHATGTGSITMRTNKPFYVQAVWPPARLTNAAHCPSIAPSGGVTVFRKGVPLSSKTSVIYGNVARVDASGAGEWTVSVRFANLPSSGLPRIAVSAYLPKKGGKMKRFRSKTVTTVTALASPSAIAAQNGDVETTELLGCGPYFHRLTKQLSGPVLPDQVFPEASASISEGGNCGDKAHGFYKSCSIFNYWQSAIAVASRMSNDLDCFDFKPNGATCGIYNTRCQRQALFFCRIKGCTLTGTLPPRYGFPSAGSACCSCKDSSKFL
eukprot:TRINITY_DN10_c0_g1_i1.p1 TRINITY_DN10_c0_g1~~TRINITY_DN10_c0_g1_i1.p1  ORF type:complete len:640 (+),score=48.53 TRINITY_DN10_c0_g1_i1:78-1997(+)